MAAGQRQLNCQRPALDRRLALGVVRLPGLPNVFLEELHDHWRAVPRKFVTAGVNVRHDGRTNRGRIGKRRGGMLHRSAVPVEAEHDGTGGAFGLGRDIDQGFCTAIPAIIHGVDRTCHKTGDVKNVETKTKD